MSGDILGLGGTLHMVPFHRSTRSGIADNGKRRLQPQHSMRYHRTHHNANHGAFLSLGCTPYVLAVAAEVGDGRTGAQLLSGCRTASRHWVRGACRFVGVCWRTQCASATATLRCRSADPVRRPFFLARTKSSTSARTGTRLGAEIMAQIGAGGMGEVYRARDTKLNRDVAIKVLPDSFADDPERLARFQREAQSARVAESSEHRAHLRPRGQPAAVHARW